MTALDQTTTAPVPAPMVSREVDCVLPVKLRFDPSDNLVRTLFRGLGTVFILSSALMWLLPGSLIALDVIPMKLGASVFFLLCGLALLMRNHVTALPEVYFDPIRREMRVLQKNDKGRPETVLRRGYDTLGGAYISTTMVELWNEDGSTLLRLPVVDPDLRMALRQQLGALCA